MQKDNINEFSLGVHQDSSVDNQPKGTYRFALNTVNETELGDFSKKGNEESNELCADFHGYIPIGKVYTTENEMIIFLVSPDDSVSEIGILDNNCLYTPLINDADSLDEYKLNFKVDHQIDAVYRLRRGCERTVYFTDDLNKPRIVNIDSLEDYKTNGLWDSRLFNLFRDYNEIPKFQNVQVLDSGGSLLPGSYNIAVQYLDEGLNPTEWIVVSPTINIYNDLSNMKYPEISGSVNSDTDYLNFGPTSKAIRVQLDDLDNTFIYYRLAIIASNNGSGLVNSVEYSEVVPTTKNFYIFTGNNAVSTGTEEEILAFNEIIYKAKNIEQIENRLLLANSQGKQVNFCKLQKYASRIKADCVLKEVNLSTAIDPSNPKNPTVHFGGTGYMPGDIYSFGIVYVFKDGSLSPVYHIPGKNHSTVNQVFSPGTNIVPMSIENQSENTFYNDNDSCITNDYWGLDSEGISLKDKFVRHHRFPLRSELAIPLVEVEDQGDEQTLDYYNVRVTISGDLITPTPCDTKVDPDCVTPEGNYFEVRIRYTVDGQNFYFTTSIDADTYADGSGEYALELDNIGQYHGSSNIVVTSIQATNSSGIYEDLCTSCTSYTWSGSTYFNGDANITTSVGSYTQTLQSRNYKTKILGIQFSGIDLPSLEDTNGEEIIGYYIVRNERTEFEKTIMDSGVLLPTLKNQGYISQGLLMPETWYTGTIENSVWGMIHPEHKFYDKEYVTYDEMIHQGNFTLNSRKYGKVTTQDVLDGTSWDPDKHKGNSQTDDDGWSFDLITRDNIVNFESKNDFTKLSADEDFEERFYLDALESRAINDNADEVYNIAADNKVGIVKFKPGEELPYEDKLPYVVLKRNNADPYSNFRVLPYYKDSVNMEEFNSNGNTISQIFGGDSYIAPMRYVNTMFWDNRVALRAGKTNVWNYILGAVLIAVGVVLAIFSGGSSSVLVVLGAGIMAAAGGALLISSGIKADNIYKAYAEEWEKGLKETTLDTWVRAFYQYEWNPSVSDSTGGLLWNYFPAVPPFNAPYVGQYRPPSVSKTNVGQDGPSDDTIQWIGEAVTDLWFESSINISLRTKMITESPTFLDAPGRIESGNNNPIDVWEYFGVHWTSSKTRPPVSSLERHLVKKLLMFDAERQEYRKLLGVPLGEWYNINPDYQRANTQKIYSHLPLEYDCCTECMEDFPHRIHYSEPSFQEELSDNYRVFLPNNYRDIDAETGEITNVFKLGNNLFVHTLEGLWQVPRNYQERVTDQIVSFVGTGSYFEISPQKIIDDDTGNSAGLQHKWSAIKIPQGYFFVTENQRKIYKFDGKQLLPISNIGLSNWFKEHTEILLDRQYRDSSGYKYPYRDNPSNLLGTGFISTYDTKKERLIFTKKDVALSSDVTDNEDYTLCTHDGVVTIFPNVTDIIQSQQDIGWNYEGLENCRMKFSREIEVTRTEIREVETTVPNTAHIYAFYDTSGSFNSEQLQSIRDATDAWYSSFRPDDVGMTRLHKINLGTERWLDFAAQAALDPAHNGDILVISFVNEADSAYHDTTIVNPVTGQPTVPPTAGDFTTDYNNFVNTVLPSLNFFLGINYSIATNWGAYQTSKAFAQHSLLAIKGVPYSTSEANAIIDTLADEIFNSGNKADLLATMTATNPYSSLGTPLSQLGWLLKVDRNDLDYISSGGTIPVITPEQLTEDINALLADSVTYEEVEVEVTYLETEYMYIDGEVIDDPVELNNSWTISFSLKSNEGRGSWVSWHSYMPNFYISVPEKFYSWIHGSNFLWKHNRLGHYQTYYGEYKPFVLEYVSLSTPVITRLWNHIRLQTEAERYIPATNSYVDERHVTFNKMVLSNSRQCSGEMDLVVKDTMSDPANYMLHQVVNTNDNSSIIDRTERDWIVNDFRDIRTDYTQPIWDHSISSVQDEYFIDKVLNTSTLDVSKDWSQLESFRDKYLVVRLIFDNFASKTPNVKLIMNYSVENEQQSFH